MLDFRSDYMKNLQTEVDVNAMNLQANVVYKSTGQLPPQSSMPDTRTTTEKLADKVRLKVELMSELKPIGGADFAMQAIQAIENSPLNANGDLFIYFAQNSKEYVALLKKKYKYGIKGDANDALQLAKFVEKGYNDTKALTGSVKSSFNRPYSSIDKVNEGDIQKTIDALTLLSAKAVAKYGNNVPVSAILAETIGLNQSIKANMPTKVQIDAIRDVLQESGQDILNFDPQPGQPFHNDEEFVQVYNRYLELIDDLPYIPTLFSLFEQLEKNILNASPQVPTQIAINIRNMYGPLITIPNLTAFGGRFRALVAGIQHRGAIIPPVVMPYLNAAPVVAYNAAMAGAQAGVAGVQAGYAGLQQGAAHYAPGLYAQAQGYAPYVYPAAGVALGAMSMSPAGRQAIIDAAYGGGSYAVQGAYNMAQSPFARELAADAVAYGVHPILGIAGLTRTYLGYGGAAAEQLAESIPGPGDVAEGIEYLGESAIDGVLSQGPSVMSILRGGLTAIGLSTNNTGIRGYDNSSALNLTQSDFGQNHSSTSGPSGLPTSYFGFYNPGNSWDNYYAGSLGNLDYYPPSLPGPYQPSPSISATQPPQAEFIHWGPNGPIRPGYSQVNPIPSQQPVDEPNSPFNDGQLALIKGYHSAISLLGNPDTPAKEKKTLSQVVTQFIKSYSDKYGGQLGMAHQEAIDNGIDLTPSPNSETPEEYAARNNIKLSGNGLKRGRGRPKGSGIAHPFKDKIDTSRGIEPDRRYVKFGRFLINTNKLKDDVVAIKRPSGANIVQYPSQRVTPHLSHIFKTIVGGGNPSFNDLSKLNDDERNYLYNVSKKAEIVDKLSIPTPSKDQRDKDIHEYEVMKGEILSGNDNKDLIKRFKIHMSKLSKSGILPKHEVSEILTDLLELGH